MNIDGLPKCKMKALKCNLNSILRTDGKYKKFYNCIERMNELAFRCSNFIRLYILSKLKENQKYPTLDSNFIRMSFKVLSKSTVGKPPSDHNKKILMDLEKFYNEQYSKIYKEKYDSNLLPHIWNYVATEMETSYKNNITINFQEYLRKFINRICIQHEMEISKRTERQIRNDKKFMKELFEINKDFINGTNLSCKKFSELINSIKTKLFPKLSDGVKNILDDVALSPMKYLGVVIRMNNYLEKHNLKMFQSIPLKTELKTSYIHIDTSALRCIFKENGKNKNNKTDNEVWNTYLNINPKKFKIKGYTFNNSISTDGKGVSILFMENNEKIKNDLKKEKFAEKRKETCKKKKELTSKKYKEFLESKEDDKNKKKDDFKLKQQKKRNKMKEKFTKLSKEEQEQIKMELRLKHNEFNYIEDVVKIKKFENILNKKFKNNEIVVVDPGMVDILTMLNKSKNGFQISKYSCRRRIKAIKRNKYMKLRQHKYDHMIKQNINTIKLNKKILEISNKTCDYDKFYKLIQMKKLYLETISKNTADEYKRYLRKLRWFSYINTRRHEDQLLNELIHKYGEGAVFICGDWDQQTGIKRISVPNDRMLKLLSKKFKVYLINEFNTSKINCKTKEINTNLKCKVVDGTTTKIREIHRVLTYKMGKRMGCINRDRNSVINMMNIVEYLLKHKERPKEFINTFTTHTMPTSNHLLKPDVKDSKASNGGTY